MKAKRLPNGFGSISRLSGNRRRPFMIRNKERQILGYSETYEEAYLLLCDYNKSPWDVDLRNATVADVWELFCTFELDRFSENTQKRYQSIYHKYFKKISNSVYSEFKTYNFMLFLKNLECSENTRGQIIALLKHLDDIAFQMDIINKKYAHELRSKGFERKKERIPFTEEEIQTLWENIDVEFVDYVLIMIYTGFRRDELVDLKLENIDTEQWIIRGGSKTQAGKNRIVPLHERIRPLVLNIMENATSDQFYPYGRVKFWNDFKRTTKEILGFEHIPHEARHTLRTRLDRVGANKVAIDRILGHKSGDTGMDIYTHKTVEELHQAIGLLD